MPVLRYRIGDLAVAMDPAVACSCGRGAARIGAIQGRVQSTIQGTEGRCLPGTFFSQCLEEYDYAFKRFQVVQTERDAMTFRAVKAGRFSQSVLDEVLATFRKHLGESMRIDVELVDESALGDPGLHLASVSRLDLDFQRAAR
jgi:phenylacetate-CoA ligase